MASIRNPKSTVPNVPMAFAGPYTVLPWSSFWWSSPLARPPGISPQEPWNVDNALEPVNVTWPWGRLRHRVVQRGASAANEPFDFTRRRNLYFTLTLELKLY